MIKQFLSNNLNIAEERNSPKKGYPTTQALYADPDVWAFPIDTPSRVRSAISYFSKHDWRTDINKKNGARKILKAAKKFGIKVSEDSDVYKTVYS